MAYSSDWFSANIPNWTKWLKEFKGKPNLEFLEIGCWEGRATVWLLQNILTDPSSEITVIDTFEGGQEVGEHGAFYCPEAKKNFIDNIAPYSNQVRVEQGISQSVLRDWEAGFIEDKFDFVYIDGSHRSPDILEDTMLVWRIVKPGGIVVWDDYGLHRYPDPKLNPAMAIDAFLRIFDGKYTVVARGYQVAVKKL